MPCVYKYCKHNCKTKVTHMIHYGIIKKYRQKEEAKLISIKINRDILNSFTESKFIASVIIDELLDEMNIFN